MAPELLKVVAAEAAKIEEGGESALPAVKGMEQNAALSTLMQARPEVSAISQPGVVETSSPVDVQHTGVPAMNTPLGRPGWSEDLSERVVWMTGKGMQSAELQLNPKHLGPVEVRINLTQDQASIQFVAHHAGVREAIEAAIPKLREMLGTQQMNLADVSVSQHSFSEQKDYRGAQFAYDQQSQPGRQGTYQGSGSEDEPGLIRREGEHPITQQSGRGLLNLYA